MPKTQTRSEDTVSTYGGVSLIRRSNEGVPGWDAAAPDAEGLVLDCPNPDCERNLSLGTGVTAAPLACPYCGTYYTAARQPFEHTALRLETEGAGREGYKDETKGDLAR